MAISNKAFKGKMKKDIVDFLNILSRLSISYKSIDHKEMLPDHLWGYSIKELKFLIENSTLKHIRPKGFSNLEVLIDIDVVSQNAEWEKLNDPFDVLNFRTLLKGTNKLTGHTHYLSFHIDRHNGGSTNEIHPLYHMQYLQNGKAKPKDEFDHGESLQLDIPRMMHLPMELILGVSVIISNFAPKLYEKLLKDRQFINLTKEYQVRVWRPYFNSLESYWLTPMNNRIWDPKLNCPYLI
ncbi:hypothetical protein [uncultured Chryseobacterium sp.]|uniref:hypothetical protein n=1 Tax=uncultured Chryseobacterium sp. TaxID=259322 RepID=UPI0025E1588D|nr:hypothetical protein [uncultured Chryseobacterium sp.]